LKSNLLILTYGIVGQSIDNNFISEFMQCLINFQIYVAFG